jgi:hypothetical protein
MQHLGGECARPFEVDKAGDVPVLVHEDVALMEVGQHKREGPLSLPSVRKVRDEGAHHRQR